MSIKRKILYALAALTIVSASMAIAYITLRQVGVVNQDKKAQSTIEPRPSTPAEKEMQKGRDAQSKGESKKALEYYEAAKSQCEDSDQECKVNADIKINDIKMGMKSAEKQEAKLKQNQFNLEEFLKKSR